jgi:UDP-3-O-[3-hydroxymyristoyl] glucosamine N-acyltransferase
MDPPEGKALIFSEDPFMDFMKLIRKYRPFLGAQEMISQTARIGEGTIIQPGVFIGEQVQIGKDCIIHPNVTIYAHSIIGNNVIIHSGSVIGADGFYFQKRKDHIAKFESCGRVVIRDHVEIGACCTIDRGVTGDTVIDEYTKFDNHIQVGHDTYIGKRCMFASAVLVAGVTRIEDDVTLWGQVTVNKDITIHAGAVVLAVSAVDKTLEGHKTYFGAPAIEASKKWREMAMLRKLPEIYQKMK